MTRVYRDRHDAGVQLAHALHRYADADAVVLAHSRSSVPVAYEVATRLGLPLALLGDLDQERRGGDVDPALVRREPSSASLLALEVAGKIVVLVEDGDGARAMPATIEDLRAQGAATVVAAVAVIAPQISALLHAAADYLHCGLSPQHIYSLQAWFADSEAPSEDDIRQLLVAAAHNLLLIRRRRAMFFLSQAVDT
jgi:putative phosphoribosyl transferase